MPITQCYFPKTSSNHAFLLSAMEYTDTEVCCKRCLHFVPADLSGHAGAMNAHCRLNPAFYIEIDEEGQCGYFKKMEY